MNYDLLFIQKYYHYLIIFFLIVIPLIILGYLGKNNKNRGVFVIFMFAFFMTLYIGSRDFYIGVNTLRYHNITLKILK